MWYVYVAVGAGSVVIGWLASNLWFNWKYRGQRLIPVSEEIYQVAQAFIDIMTQDSEYNEIDELFEQLEAKPKTDKEEFEELLSEFSKKLGDKYD